MTSCCRRMTSMCLLPCQMYLTRWSGSWDPAGITFCVLLCTVCLYVCLCHHMEFFFLFSFFFESAPSTCRSEFRSQGSLSIVCKHWCFRFYFSHSISYHFCPIHVVYIWFVFPFPSFVFTFYHLPLSSMNRSVISCQWVRSALALSLPFWWN